MLEKIGLALAWLLWYAILCPLIYILIKLRP